MRNLLTLMLVAFPFLLTGCVPTTVYYAPVMTFQKAGYITGKPLEPGAVQKSNTDVDLARYRFVYLEANSEIYPARFEFLVRDALARMGFKQVLNREELNSLIMSNNELLSIRSITDPEGLKQLALKTDRFLYVNYFLWYGGQATLSVTSYPDGNVLFQIQNDRPCAALELDANTNYPVFDELKKWRKACTGDKKI